jgi:ribosomal protein L31E
MKIGYDGRGGKMGDIDDYFLSDLENPINTRRQNRQVPLTERSDRLNEMIRQQIQKAVRVD